MKRSQTFIPQAWPWAVRAGIESVLVPVMLVALLSVISFIAVSQHDAAAALGISHAASIGVGLWTLGWGGALGSATQDAGVLSLPMLSVTVAQSWWTWTRLAPLRDTGRLMALWVAVSASAAASVVCVFAPVPARVWPVPIIIAVMTALLAFIRGSGAVRETVAMAVEEHLWVVLAWRLVWQIGAVLGAASLLMVFSGVVARWSHILRLIDALGVSGVSWLGVVALHVAWLPTIVVWALAWLVGPGFRLGAGSVFSPGKVVAGAVPAMPIFGILPDGPVGPPQWLNYVVPIMVSLVALGVAAYNHRAIRAVSMREVLYATGSATLVVTLCVMLLSVMSTGSIGPGRMSVVGPRVMLVTVLVGGEVIVGLMVASVLAHPTTHDALRRLVSRGVSASGLAHVPDDELTTQPSSSSTASSISASSPSESTMSEPMTESARMSASQAPVAHPPTSQACVSVQGSEQELGDRATRLVVLVSGTGSNLRALIEACHDPSYGATIVAVGADKECEALTYAENALIPTMVADLADFDSRDEWNEALAQAVAEYEPDLIVCAGFMRILGQPFLQAFDGRIINTHPSLLPNFPGAHAVRDALAAGATTTGATLFWVDAGVDTGAIISQVSVDVHDDDTEETLTARVKAAETPHLIEQVGLLARSVH